MKAFENKNNGCISSVELKCMKYKVLYYVMFSVLVLLVIISFLPSIWILLSGFKESKEMYQIPPSFLPRNFRIGKLIYVWNKYSFLKNYISTFILSIGELAFNLFFTGLAGYVLSRLKPKGTKQILALIFWTMMLPAQTRMIPLFMLFIDVPFLHLNLTNTYWPMWLMAATNTFDMLLFKSFFDTIPTSYLEAARIDGYSNFGIFYKIIIPLSKPIFVVVSVFCINSSWSSFLWPLLILKSENLQVLSVKLFQMKSTCPIDDYMLSIIYSIIPPVIMYLIFQKQILSGLNIGGIKG